MNDNISQKFTRSQDDFAVPTISVAQTKPGIDKKTVTAISAYKNEDRWFLDFRLRAFETFTQQKMPEWGPDLSNIHFDEITYYLRATDKRGATWEELPADIKATYDRIGVPEHERTWLGGVSAQYESEVVYESLQKELDNDGVIFCDMDTACKKYPSIVKKYLGTLIPPTDNKFAALNSAAWSGGSFIYIPRGIHVKLPLQAYFRINAERFGQFERTLIIADEGSSVHYIEGCTAPTYSTRSLHAAVVEIFAHAGAHVRYSTIQNWSTNIYNLVTKRARAEANATIEWIDCNLGSGVTMKYPSVILAGERSRGSVISMALAHQGQELDTGARMIHLAPYTSSHIISKSVSCNGGISTYRGKVLMNKNAQHAKNFTQCDALLLDDHSQSLTYPITDIQSNTAHIAHEASIEYLDPEKLFYLSSRGLSLSEARSILINGFITQITKEIPLEYSVELNRLIAMEMEKI